MRPRKVAALGERLDEVEGVPDVVAPAVLGIAPVGRAVGGGREVAARRAVGQLARAARVGELGEAPRVALRHQRHDADAGVEGLQHRGELAHRQALAAAPERDGVLAGLPAPRSVIGDVEQQGVAGPQGAPAGVEPVLDVAARRRREHRARHVGVLVGDRRAQRSLERASLEQPEVGLGLRLAHGHVGRGIGTVAHVQRHQARRHAGAQQDVVQRAQVEQVGLVVLRLRPSTVDHQDLEARDLAGRRRSLRGRGGEGTDRAASKHQERGGRESMPAARRGAGGRHAATVAAAPRGRNSHAAACRGPGSGRGGLDADRAPVGCAPLSQPHHRLAQLRTERDDDRERTEEAADHQSL